MLKEDVQIIEMTFVNAFLIKVIDGFILIDTGLSMFWERLENELLMVGCLPDKLKLVVITHGDTNHIGNCAILQEKYKCKIAMHKDDSLMAEESLVVKRKVKTLMAKIFIFLRRLKRRKIAFKNFKPDVYLVDGQSLNGYGLNASVVHIPGHTKGSIGILADDGSLFAGDTFTNRKKPDTATYIENSEELKNSIVRLKSMPIKTIYPGHGKPFDIKEITCKL